MKKRVSVKKPAIKRVIDTSPKARMIPGEEVARALGATPTGDQIPANLPPDAHLEFVRKVGSEIVSTGGRPGRKGDTERKKIPLTRDEWQQLECIAEECNRQGVAASPAQIGGLLVREGLRAYNVGDRNEVLGAAASSAEELAQLQPVAEALLHKMKSRSTSRKAKGD